MKVYLDDERPTPPGWRRVYWPNEAIELLQTGHVTELSLDHDLGDDDRGTGYDVVLWLEEAVITQGFMPPIIKVHSANSSAREKMERGIRQIEKAHDSVFQEPWQNINAYGSSVQRAMQQQLNMELSASHRLYNKKLKPLAKRDDCDDVLFADLESEQVFVVQLTWSHLPQSAPYPRTEVYGSFAEFASQRMEQDHFDYLL